jgi:hypothetical protein
MGQLKECDARDRLSTGRSKIHPSFRPAAQADPCNTSGIEMDGAKADKPTFAEDFMLEHSHSGLLVAMMGSVGSYIASSKELHKSTQHYGFPS